MTGYRMVYRLTLMEDGGIFVFYRKRVYQISPEQKEAFRRYFHRVLYPNEAKYGARLVGQWINGSGTEMTVIWQYLNRAHYEGVQKHLQADPRAIHNGKGSRRPYKELDEEVIRG
ncbi:NIPSNAP protein [Melghirimyces profundicolus]|uniref:NIPSNAP protein n=1 Tax=Melghirimyces profundicolus TaxID=1242148 RepID=A0A2T6BXI0_9BACL|nr:NIPSNAP protein [Melghirimyces profundicolus]